MNVAPGPSIAVSVIVPRAQVESFDTEDVIVGVETELTVIVCEALFEQVVAGFV